MDSVAIPSFKRRWSQEFLQIKNDQYPFMLDATNRFKMLFVVSLVAIALVLSSMEPRESERQAL